MNILTSRSSNLYNYRYLLILGFLATMVAAFFSMGSHHPDEHFQILEFAYARLGFSDSGGLPWEFKEEARPALQPFLAIMAIKLFQFIGVSSPFLMAFIIRVITGACTWLVGLFLIKFFIEKFKTKRGRLFFVICMQFLWFIPYVNVRFSSEILSGSSFILGLLFLLTYLDSSKKKKANVIIAGLLIGFSFYFRFQIAGAIIGLFAWLLYDRKLSFIGYLMLFFGVLMAILISMGIDVWFYEKLIFTPWNYFYFQLVLGKAATFGVSPWWHYFDLFLVKAVPPISILLFVFFIIGAVKNKSHVFLWVIISFVLLHMAIGHKEMRFLFPILPLFLVVSSLGFDYLMDKANVGKWLLISVKTSFVLNLLFLVYRTLAPAQELISYYQFLYNQSSEQKTLVISLNEDAYRYMGLPISFYKSPNIETQHFVSYEKAEEYITAHSDQPILILHRALVLHYKFTNFSADRVYTILPDWVSKFNINDWQSRANLYSIYRLNPKKIVPSN